MTTATSPTMDPSQAYFYGTFVQAAYAMFVAGNLAPPLPASFPPGYRLALYLTGTDHVARRTEPEFFGFVAQSIENPASLVVALRGTDTMLEWLVDAEFASIAFTRVAGAGHVEDGFCSIYDSLAAHTPDGEPADLHDFLRRTSPTGPVTVVGHSLGAAVATLLALDIAVNDAIAMLALYTLASPRVGNAAFATFFDAHVPTCWRVVNAPDIVPRLPPLYTHVSTAQVVDSLDAGVRHSLACYHSATTYQYLLDPQNPVGRGECGA